MWSRILIIVSILANASGFGPIIRPPTAPVAASKYRDLFNVPVGADRVFLREAELKHGRLAMLACIIIPLTEQFTNNLGINQLQLLPIEQQVALLGIMFSGEFTSMLYGWENPMVKPFALKKDYQPGDFKFGIFKPTEYYLEKMDQELNHGRLAMIAVLGIIAQEAATGAQLFSYVIPH